MTTADEYLAQALDKYERNRKSDRVFVNLAVEKTHAAVAKLEKELAEMEVAGIIECRRKRTPGGMIEKFKLLSPEAAYQRLGRVPSWESSANRLEGIKEEAEEGLRQILEEIESSWSRNVAWVGSDVRLAPGDTEDLGNAVKIARELIRLDRTIDYRTLSLAAGCSSKAFERSEDLVAVVAAALSGRDRDGRSAREFLGELGAEKLSQAVFVAAPKSLPVSYMGFPPEEIRAFKFQKADYILSVENWVSFVRYAREVKDNGIVFYSAGFPSKSWRQAYIDVVMQQTEATAFHWGDVDEAGLRIASTVLEIAKSAGLDVMPHQMSRDVVEGQPEAVFRAGKIVTKVPKLACDELRELWSWLMSPEGKTLEQESLDPVSPMKAMPPVDF